MLIDTICAQCMKKINRERIYRDTLKSYIESLDPAITTIISPNALYSFSVLYNTNELITINFWLTRDNVCGIINNDNNCQYSAKDFYMYKSKLFRYWQLHLMKKYVLRRITKQLNKIIYKEILNDMLKEHK